MDSTQVENVAASLVREYLSRKGLRSTLQIMDEELPRTDASISNRPTLMKELHIEHQMKKNKELATPFKAMIEVIVRFLMQSGPSHHSDHEPREHRKHRYRTEQDRQEGEKQEDKAPGRKHHGSMVLEDSIEGETFAGDGRAALLDKEEEKADITMTTTTTRVKSGKSRGMSGPISSNIEDRHRRMKRPPSATSRHKTKTESSKNELEESVINNNAALDYEVTKEKNRTDRARTIRKENSSEQIVDVLSIEDKSDNKLKSRRQSRESNFSLLTREKPLLEPERTRGNHDDDILGGYTKESSRSSRRKSSKTNHDENEAMAERPHSRHGRHKHKVEDDLHSYDVTKSSVVTDKTPTRGGSASSTGSSRSKSKMANKVGDVEIGDVDDIDSELADLDLSRSQAKPAAKVPKIQVETKPMDVRTAVDLKTLIFGQPNQQFNDEWLYQSFSFCDLPNLQYGIVQKKGGPCGVLAAVQACMLQELLFSTERSKASHDVLDPDRKTRTACLVKALSQILWRAGENKQAIITSPSGRAQFSGSSKCKADNLTETLMLNFIDKYEDLEEFTRQQINQFESDSSPGVVLFMYSLILSRTFNKIRADMDVSTNTLMGAHGYCSQELVNLIMTGKAASNVFNDTIEFDSGDGKLMVLKGIPHRSDIGLLSLFEHYKSCEVGTFMKTPRYPIWVVCSESHFSVLFSLRKDLISDWKAERRFDLYYYDGLARQEEEIKLTIDTTSRDFRPPNDEDLVPPLEHCIRTKWKDAIVDWNGTEPLL